MNRSSVSASVAALAALCLACGDSGPTEPEPHRNNLVFTRADQSEIVFSPGALLYVWCGPWEEGMVGTPSVQVIFGGPGVADPKWHLRAVTADVAVGEVATFPNAFIWDQPRGADLFVYDPANELSTQGDGSTGSITFQQLQCGSGGLVQFSIDATIDSEFGNGPPVTVTGTFRASITQPPGS